MWCWFKAQAELQAQLEKVEHRLAKV